MRAIKRDPRRFQRGSGVYNCGCCKRATHGDGGDHEALRLCFECYEVAGWENRISDSGPNWEGLADAEKEIDRLNAIVISKGGKLS